MEGTSKKRPKKSLRVNASSRHALTARLDRAVRASTGLQFVGSRVQGEDRDQTGAAGMLGDLLRVPLKEGGGGLFNKGVLEPHISSALGNSLGPWSAPTSSQKWLPFSRILRNGKDGGIVKLSGTHLVAKRTVLEADMNATWQRFHELSARLTHTTARQRVLPLTWRSMGLPDSARITLCAASDLRQRRRLALESQLGDESTAHTLSMVTATDFAHRPSWGLAYSQALWPKIFLFFRHISEANAYKVVVQSVYKPTEKHTVSAIVAGAKSRPFQGGNSWTPQPVQAGVSWTALLSTPGNKHKESLELKALCSQDGAWAINFSATIGVPMGAP